ncbi:MAG: hypothetical protein L0229_20220 [Blastocatellia bacterium]|nr:hypothetical protein [Blastocatellia bacterium]
MAIVAADLKGYLSASMPENDTDTSGGAIDTAGRFEITDIVATDQVTVISDGADTRTVTITGRDAAGGIVSEALVLNGATRVVGAQLFERILKIVLSAGDGTRTVTVTRDDSPTFTVIATLGPNITKARRLFYDSASESGATTRYEKEFWKNEHGTLQLNNATVKLTADPSAKIEIGVATAKDDTGSVTNRKTAPGGVTFVDDGVAQNVPTGALAAGETIGVWVKMVLAGSAAPVKSTFTTELAGTSV